MQHKVIATLWLSKPVDEACVGIVIIETANGERKAYIGHAHDHLSMERLKEDPRLGANIREEQLLMILKHLKKQELAAS